MNMVYRINKKEREQQSCLHQQTNTQRQSQQLVVANESTQLHVGERYH